MKKKNILFCVVFLASVHADGMQRDTGVTISLRLNSTDMPLSLDKVLADQIKEEVYDRAYTKGEKLYVISTEVSNVIATNVAINEAYKGIFTITPPSTKVEAINYFNSVVDGHIKDKK
jgi:hypothetical protein